MKMICKRKISYRSLKFGKKRSNYLKLSIKKKSHCEPLFLILVNKCPNIVPLGFLRKIKQKFLLNILPFFD